MSTAQAVDIRTQRKERDENVFGCFSAGSATPKRTDAVGRKVILYSSTRETNPTEWRFEPFYSRGDSALGVTCGERRVKNNAVYTNFYEEPKNYRRKYIALAALALLFSPQR